MPELILLLIIPVVVFSQQLIAGFMAKSMGRRFWVWFAIALILPVIAVLILAFLEDENSQTSVELADHVKRTGH